MTIEEAMPLISASTDIVAKLVEQIMDSAHMSDDQRKAALALAVANLDATSEKIKNARFDGPTTNL